VAVIDISVPVHSGLVVWEGDSAPLIERVRSIEEGDGYNLSRLVLSAHTGTHVDAPLHFIDEGESVEQLPLEALIGPALVVDARDAGEEIDADTVGREVDATTERVIFATRNSELWDSGGFTSDFVGVSPEAAALLVERGARLVGIDYLSVGSPEVHRTLLSNGVVLLEGLDLRGIEAGHYRLVCLPLNFAGADGAPARVVLTSP
jgi:arylformamidase